MKSWVIKQFPLTHTNPLLNMSSLPFRNIQLLPICCFCFELLWVSFRDPLSLHPRGPSLAFAANWLTHSTPPWALTLSHTHWAWGICSPQSFKLTFMFILHEELCPFSQCWWFLSLFGVPTAPAVWIMQRYMTLQVFLALPVCSPFSSYTERINLTTWKRFGSCLHNAHTSICLQWLLFWKISAGLFGIHFWRYCGNFSQLRAYLHMWLTSLQIRTSLHLL